MSRFGIVGTLAIASLSFAGPAEAQLTYLKKVEVDWVEVKYVFTEEVLNSCIENFVQQEGTDNYRELRLYCTTSITDPNADVDHSLRPLNQLPDASPIMTWKTGYPFGEPGSETFFELRIYMSGTVEIAISQADDLEASGHPKLTIALARKIATEQTRDIIGEEKSRIIPVRRK